MPPSPDFDALSPAEEKERLYRSIFEATSDGLIVHDLETGRVVKANPAASAIHGYTREEFIGLHPTAFIHPDSQHLFTQAAQVLQSGGVFQARMVHLHQDGSPFHVEVRGTAFTYQERPCLLSVVRDVSERVRAEQLLQQQAEVHTREQSALAIFHERQRLAQELHDAVNQSLFSAGLIAEVLPRLWERDPEEARRSLEDLRRLTRGALAEMRLLLAELRPSALTDTELGDLLRLLGNALAGRTNVPVTVTVAGQGALPTEVQVALYRLCQEALNNIAKHAGASRVKIHLQHATDVATLSIRDDGRGFDPEQTPSGHYGLSMMRERAEAVGAVLSVTSQLGHGTEIAIRWQKASEQKAQ
jgi:PAS domain S-box-containing protein